MRNFTCDNCNEEIKPKTGLAVAHNGIRVASLCNECVNGVTIMRLVLERRDKITKQLKFDSYQILKMETSS
jgi:hypothetical protein